MTFGSGGQRSNPLSYGWKSGFAPAWQVGVYHAGSLSFNGKGCTRRTSKPPSVSQSRLRVLLTGAGGRIGPHILPTFRDRFELRLLDRCSIPGHEPTILADLSDPDVLRNAMEDIDVVVHLAATSDEAPFVEQLVPNNVVGLFHILDSARLAGVRRVVFASTVQAVGFYPAGTTVQGSDVPRPVTLYGCTKALGETMGRYYHDKFGLEFVAVRIGWFLDYDAPQLRRFQGARDVWLSPRDAAGILAAATETSGIGYCIANATSITDFERLSRTECREQLGYEALDRVSDIPFAPDPS